MGNRLSKIYTRTGDDGSTGLGDGSRTGKDSLRVSAYGTVDEANSAIGLVLACEIPDELRSVLVAVQHQMFDLGGELCIPGHAAIFDADIDRINKPRRPIPSGRLTRAECRRYYGGLAAASLLAGCGM